MPGGRWNLFQQSTTRTTGSGPNVLTSRMGGGARRSSIKEQRPVPSRLVPTIEKPSSPATGVPACRHASRAPVGRPCGSDTVNARSCHRTRRHPAQAAPRPRAGCAGRGCLRRGRSSIPAAARPGRRSGALRPAPRSACSSEKVRRRWPVGRSTTGAIVTMPPRLPRTWCPKSWPHSAGTIRP